MMLIVGTFLFWIYVVLLLAITLFCLTQFYLLIQYRFYKIASQNESRDIQSISLDHDSLPLITVQLPVYNERYVIARLIDNIAQLDYPKDKLEIQVIDDSDDVTKEIAAQKVEIYKSRGFMIEHIRRPLRSGYKAGALRDALPFARGKLIAIFDADFLPHPDFLKRTVLLFNDPKVGVVQTRWEHINESYSLLTRLQAFQLNVHFTVEQKGRDYADFWLQFNGTAGVWRKETIIDAGGWEADTLTEDLDLSYRAQLKGWKIIFREDIGSPSELPSEMNGLKSQQFRWMKGGAETAKKLIPLVLKSQAHPFIKFHAMMHLLSSSVYLFVFLLGVLSVPILILLSSAVYIQSVFSFFGISLLCIIIVYIYANVDLANKERPLYMTILKMIFIFPVFLSLSMGLSLHNSIAVVKGYLGKKTSFIRTPKFNIQSLTDQFMNKKDYLSKPVSLVTLFEGILALYFATAVYMGYKLDNHLFTLLHLLLFFGYSTVFFYSIRHLSLEK